MSQRSSTACSMGPASAPTISLGRRTRGASVVGARLERGDRGQRLALEELQERASAGGNIGNIFFQTKFSYGGERIAAAGDGEALRGGDGARERLGPPRIRVLLEHPDGAVPHDRAGPGNLLRVGLCGL